MHAFMCGASHPSPVAVELSPFWRRNSISYINFNVVTIEYYCLGSKLALTLLAGFQLYLGFGKSWRWLEDCTATPRQSFTRPSDYYKNNNKKVKTKTATPLQHIFCLFFFLQEGGNKNWRPVAAFFWTHPPKTTSQEVLLPQ